MIESRGMTVVSDLDLATLDYVDPGLRGDAFHARLDELREGGWLARAEPLGYFVLDRESASFFLRTPDATFPGTTMLEVQGVTEGPLYERLRGNLLDLDGDEHRRLRRLVQPAFTPPAADRHRPEMRAVVAELIDPVLAAGGSCELVAALTRPYPARMIAAVMGAPAADAERLGRWANLIQGQFDPVRVATELPVLESAASEFQGYAAGLLASRRENPGEDLISELIAAEAEGDRLSESECVDLISAVLVGGVDTTQAQLAHAALLFARHPDQWALLRERPELAASAVEELLRFEPITPFTARLTRTEVEHRDVRFPANTLLFCCAASANRDPAAYERPAQFEIAAERGREKVLTFGAGPHFCLGANLARAELQEALLYLAERVERIELDGEPELESPLGIYGIAHLPMRLVPAR